MDKTIIEINGVKLEVDLRSARRVDELRVGDRVKVLIKQYSDYTVFPGTIIGFEPFQQLPTIIIAYINLTYQSAELKLIYYNSKTTDIEVVPSYDDDHIVINKAEILKKFAAQIEVKEAEIKEITRKQNYFLQNFGAYWEKETT